VTLTAVILFALARQVSPNTSLGLIVALLWLLHPVSFQAENHYHGTALQGLAVVTACALALHIFNKTEARRTVLVGCAIGLLSMLYAGVLLTIPMCAAVLSLKRRYKAAVLLIVGAAVAVSPWTIRNFIVLDAIVPGRTGLGFALHITNPAIAQTCSTVDSGCNRPPWEVQSPSDAVRTFRRDQAKRYALMRYSSSCIRNEAPTRYVHFTEAQRDQLYMKRALAFLFENPVICVRLSVAKAQDFLLTAVSWDRRVITLLAVIGGIIALAQLKSAFLALMTAGLCLPYLLSIWSCSYYRQPIEPLFFLFAVYLPLRIATIGTTLAAFAARVVPRDLDSRIGRSAFFK
jgi:hypothetical protein